jgi:glycerol uptake facilitator-like aquaporin
MFGLPAVTFVVGGYILGAYWFTSSISFANPAMTVARMFSNTFAGIAPSSVPRFVGMQILGGAVALLLIWALFPLCLPRCRQPGECERTAMSEKPTVLFVCVHNAGRDASLVETVYGRGFRLASS